jgi:hypothetical protein
MNMNKAVKLYQKKQARLAEHKQGIRNWEEIRCLCGHKKGVVKKDGRIMCRKCKRYQDQLPKENVSHEVVSYEDSNPVVEKRASIWERLLRWG